MELKARWIRFWHCLFRLHQAETHYYKNGTYIACYTCKKVFSEPKEIKQ